MADNIADCSTISQAKAMHIQLAHPEDIPALARLLTQLFTQEEEFTPNLEQQETALRQIINNPALGQIIVVRLENNIVGMVSLLYTISTALGGKVCLLEDFIIDGAQRNQGIGQQLLEFAINFAAQHNCQRITLLTDAINCDAQRLYSRMGFTASNMLPLRLSLGKA